MNTRNDPAGFKKIGCAVTRLKGGESYDSQVIVPHVIVVFNDLL